jgi:predicted DCC family thiol-disulfide oxidoreductase YuxK
MSNAVVVYDGDCGICEASSRWIIKHVPTVSVVSHYAYGLSSIGAVWFVTDDGRLEGAAAVSAILKRAESRTFRFVGMFISLPVIRFFAQLIYLAVAHNRSRISRLIGVKACGLPGPQK